MIVIIRAFALGVFTTTPNAELQPSKITTILQWPTMENARIDIPQIIPFLMQKPLVRLFKHRNTCKYRRVADEQNGTDGRRITVCVLRVIGQKTHKQQLTGTCSILCSSMNLIRS